MKNKEVIKGKKKKKKKEDCTFTFSALLTTIAM